MGKDANDPPSKPVPTYPEGTSWSGGTYLTGTDASNYTIVSSSWGAPTSALSGYGIFTNGNVGTFQGSPSNGTPSPTDIEVGATIFTGNRTLNFYWGPDAQGVQTINVSSVIKNNSTGSTQTLSDSMTVSVLRPTGVITPIDHGTAGVVAGAYGFAGQTLTSSKESATSSPIPGFVWTSSISSASVQNMGGVFAVTQTVVTHNIRQYYGVFSGQLYVEQAALTTILKNPGSMLDNFTYAGITSVGVDAQGKDNVQGSPKFPGQPASDTPYESMPNNYHSFITPKTYYRSDSFVQTLMYNPSNDPNSAGTGSIWVPVGSLTWGWGCSATYNTTTGIYVDDGN
ncbi:MAG: hypothetical protein LQ347_007095, partial [Umbilicaria vellea]